VYSGHIGHLGPFMFLKQVYSKGIDLVNAVEVAVYACIREKICNFKAKPDGNNIFGSAGKPITFLKDTNNKVLNPAQKPFRVIKQLFGAYTSPGDVVLDVFAGTGQVALTAVELGLGSVFIKKDPIQVGFLKEFLQKEASDRIDTFTSYNECNKCTLARSLGLKKTARSAKVVANVSMVSVPFPVPQMEPISAVKSAKIVLCLDWDSAYYIIFLQQASLAWS